MRGWRGVGFWAVLTSIVLLGGVMGIVWMRQAVALQAYREDHGRYPAALSELSPKYMKAVPKDPFVPTLKLGYKPGKGGYVLYSVGPDGKDDGGKPVGGKVSEMSAGDIVAGMDTDMEDM